MKTITPVTAAVAAGIAALFTASPVFAADAPKFTASCPTGITVKSNGKGRIKINGSKAAVKTFNANAWEASLNGVTIDVTRDGNEITATYTGKGGANGICQVTSADASQPPAGSNAAGALNGVPPRDQQACLAAVSQKANNGDVDVLEAYSSEANNQVIIGVGSTKARWQCLVKSGRVAEIMSMNN
ncbi:hypothetical protein [Aestuariivirga sp.]|uniref:hypothetical protein n=1 Tax=Aestuariivirga sp. TaxID=2650926 RepID=UPI0035B0DA40